MILDIVKGFTLGLTSISISGVSYAQLPRDLGNIFNRVIQETQKAQPTNGRNPEPTTNPVPAASSPGTTNLPCLSRICLNDSITKHVETVKWRDYSNEARNAVYVTEEGSRQGQVVELGSKSRQVSPPTAQAKVARRGRSELGGFEDWIKNQVKGLSAQDQEVLLPYVIMKRADSTLIRLIEDKKPIFCRAITFEGMFDSESGYQTTVQIAPSAETGELRVVALIRRYPTRDRVQLENIQREVIKEFPYLQVQGPALNTNPPWGSGLASFTPNGELSFLFYVNDQKPTFQDRALSGQQSCGAGRASVN